MELKKEDLAKLEEAKKNTRKVWSKEEEEYLTLALGKGYTPSQIATAGIIKGRTRSAIVSKCVVL